MPTEVIFKGIGGIEEFYKSVLAAIPDLNVAVLAEYDVPGCSIREAVISGTHRGEYFGVRPLGHRIRVRMAVFFEFDTGNRRLLAERAYFDQETLLKQMRGEPQ